MTLSYDKNADVLYVTFEALPPADYVFVENESGDVLKVSRASQRVVGCTIPYFAKRSRNGKISIPELNGSPLKDFTRDLAHA
jgi:hypothetical protein